MKKIRFTPAQKRVLEAMLHGGQLRIHLTSKGKAISALYIPADELFGDECPDPNCKFNVYASCADALLLTECLMYTGKKDIHKFEGYDDSFNFEYLYFTLCQEYIEIHSHKFRPEGEGEEYD